MTPKFSDPANITLVLPSKTLNKVDPDVIEWNLTNIDSCGEYDIDIVLDEKLDDETLSDSTSRPPITPGCSLYVRGDLHVIFDKVEKREIRESGYDRPEWTKDMKRFDSVTKETRKAEDGESIVNGLKEFGWTTTSKQLVRTALCNTTKSSEDTQFKVGVAVLLKGDGGDYPGVITDINDNGSFAVFYEFIDSDGKNKETRTNYHAKVADLKAIQVNNVEELMLWVLLNYRDVPLYNVQFDEGDEVKATFLLETEVLPPVDPLYDERPDLDFHGETYPGPYEVGMPCRAVHPETGKLKPQ